MGSLPRGEWRAGPRRCCFGGEFPTSTAPPIDNSRLSGAGFPYDFGRFGFRTSLVSDFLRISGLGFRISLGASLQLGAWTLVLPNSVS
jgi:hypothetical protein